MALLVPTEQLKESGRSNCCGRQRGGTRMCSGEASVATAAQPIQPAIPEAKGAQGVLFSAAPALDGNQDKAAWVDRLSHRQHLPHDRSSLPGWRFRVSDHRCCLPLDRHGDKLLISALAQLLGLPPVCLRGILGALRTLLNIDAYSVLTIDEGDMSVTLTAPAGAPV